MSSSSPLVSIVTPVYNGEKYLSECIESILNQSYEHWEYVIVNNCSTDRTLEIAQQYAQRESKIRVSTNKKFLDLMPNWNHALRQISTKSKYCKVVHADDLLWPDCIEKMVLLAEKNPSVSIIGSYYLKGKQVKGIGIPYPTSVISGHDICRSTLRKDYYVFGSPSSTLIRSNLIQGKEKFYNEDNYHADVEVCFEILKDFDFGFVHQILSYTRMHDDTQTSTKAEKLDTNMLENLKMFVKYGPMYLDDIEYQNCLGKRLRAYRNKLGKSYLNGRNKDYIQYHKVGLDKIGITFGSKDIAFAIISQILDKILNPKRTVEQIFKRF